MSDFQLELNETFRHMASFDRNSLRRSVENEDGLCHWNANSMRVASSKPLMFTTQADDTRKFEVEDFDYYKDRTRSGAFEIVNAAAQLQLNSPFQV